VARLAKSRFIRHAPSITWLLLAIVAKHLGLVQTPDGANMDWWLKLRSETNPEGMRRVAAVLVDEQDYAQAFESRSPLRIEPLAELISLVRAGEPAVILVDLDTSDPSFAGLPALIHNSSDSRVPVIWAASSQDDSKSAPELSTASGMKPKVQVLDGVLGNPNRVVPWGDTAVGMFALEKDGTVRRYFRTLAMGSGEPVHSLGFAGVRAYCRSSLGASLDSCSNLRACQNMRNCQLPVLIKYPAAPVQVSQISATNLRTLGKGAGWDATPLFKGRIVVIGGSYRSSRDFYSLPIPGPEVPGALIWAHIAAAELGEQTSEQMHPFAVGLMECVFLLVMIPVGSKLKELSPWLQLVCLSLSVVGGSIALSLVVFGNPSSFAGFLLTIAGVFLDANLELAIAQRPKGTVETS